MSRQPSLFVSHGSPMFALEPGLAGPRLAELGKALQEVKAILVVSPHWQTMGLRVTGAAHPETIHDFSGFPAALYALQYQPPGDTALAQEVVNLLQRSALDASLDLQRGLDHGAWVPLHHLRPDADLPVIQVSMPQNLDAESAFQLGKILAPLRDQGVMIIGSGSLTHNLYEFRRHINDPEYAQEFADWIAAAVKQGDDTSLIHYRSRAPHAERAHPSEEHYLPLLVALGASTPEDIRSHIVGGMTDGVLSMDSFGFGL